MFDMFGSVIKNLFSEPATRKYPGEKRELTDKARGHISGIDAEACIFCGICDRKCPANAIKVDRKNRTWEIDPFKCIVCNECVISCPKKCINMEKEHGNVEEVKTKILCQGPAQAPKEIKKESSVVNA